MGIFDRFRPGPKEVEPTPTHPEQRVPERSQAAMKQLIELRHKESGKVVIDKRSPKSSARIAEVSEKMKALEQGRYNEVREFLGQELLKFARERVRSSAQDLYALRQELAEAPQKLAARISQLEMDVGALKKKTAGGSPEEIFAHLAELRKREDQTGNVRRLLESWSLVKRQFDAIDALPAEKEK